MFPFSVAKKLPVYVYECVKFTDLSGKIVLEAPIKRGMIGIGQRFEKMTRSKGVSEIYIIGTLIFKGYGFLGKDCILFIGKDALCELGDMATLGSDVKLICTNRIIIGEWSGIGYESQIIDTNSHPMMNSITGEKFPISNPISIGNYNAVSNRVTIMPNTKTPDYCVIASNSLCNKDYTQLGEKILIGGVPAKMIKENYARDWESEKETLKENKIPKW